MIRELFVNTYRRRASCHGNDRGLVFALAPALGTNILFSRLLCHGAQRPDNARVLAKHSVNRPLSTHHRTSRTFTNIHRDSREITTFHRLVREKFVDFSPLKLDRVFAQEAGARPSIIQHSPTSSTGGVIRG
jgi:hypothetical protein